MGRESIASLGIARRGPARLVIARLAMRSVAEHRYARPCPAQPGMALLSWHSVSWLVMAKLCVALRSPSSQGRHSSDGNAWLGTADHCWVRQARHGLAGHALAERRKAGAALFSLAGHSASRQSASSEGWLVTAQRCVARSGPSSKGWQVPAKQRLATPGLQGTARQAGPGKATRSQARLVHAAQGWRGSAGLCPSSLGRPSQSRRCVASHSLAGPSQSLQRKAGNAVHRSARLSMVLRGLAGWAAQRLQCSPQLSVARQARPISAWQSVARPRSPVHGSAGVADRRKATLASARQGDARPAGLGVPEPCSAQRSLAANA
jgi:hypothetical protein